MSLTSCGITGWSPSICQMRRGYPSHWVLVRVKGTVCAKCLACRKYLVKVAVITRSSMNVLDSLHPLPWGLHPWGMAGVRSFVFNAVDCFVALLQNLFMFMMNKTFNTDKAGEGNEVHSQSQHTEITTVNILGCIRSGIGLYTHMSYLHIRVTGAHNFPTHLFSFNNVMSPCFQVTRYPPTASFLVSAHYFIV